MPSNYQEKQRQLIDFIYHMAEMTYGPDAIEECFLRLRTIYVDDFRHRYADFFPIIAAILGREGGKYSPDFLMENFQRLMEYSEQKLEEDSANLSLKDFHTSLVKLTDHLNLEISHQRHYFAQFDMLRHQNEELQSKLSDTSTQVKTTTAKMIETQTGLEDARKELKSSHLDVITVLGIFAAIAFSFMGGMSYLGGAFTSMSEMPILKALLYLLVAGFVLFNVIHLMLFIIGRIIEKEFKFFTWYTITVNAIIIAAVIAILAYYFYCFCCGFEVPNILHPIPKPQK